MRASEQIDQIATALAAAQAEFKAPPKKRTASYPTKSGGKLEYSYADLADIIESVKPIMANHGLSVSQSPSQEGDVIILYTRLMHKSGQWLEGSMRVGGDNPQQVGSCITYFRRYSLSGILGIMAEEDDDGQGTGVRASPIQASQRINSHPQDIVPDPSSGLLDRHQTPKIHKMATDPQIKMIQARLIKLGYTGDQMGEFITKRTSKKSWAEVTMTDVKMLVDEIEKIEKRAPQDQSDQDEIEGVRF